MGLNTPFLHFLLGLCSGRISGGAVFGSWIGTRSMRCALGSVWTDLGASLEEGDPLDFMDFIFQGVGTPGRSSYFIPAQIRGFRSSREHIDLGGLRWDKGFVSNSIGPFFACSSSRACPFRTVLHRIRGWIHAPVQHIWWIHVPVFLGRGICGGTLHGRPLDFSSKRAGEVTKSRRRGQVWRIWKRLLSWEDD